MRSLYLIAITVTLYSNAYWWNGNEFVFGDRYVTNTHFSDETEQAVDATVDLNGQFIIPPLADAHNHNLQNPALAQRFQQRYIQQGVLYGAMLCGDPASAAETRLILSQAQLDMRVAGACVSSSDGHPLRMAMAAGERSPEEIYDKSYIVIDERTDIDAKAGLFERAGGDLTKLILVHHEDIARRDNNDYFGLNGLQPEVVAPLTRTLQERGQTVVVHTESAADFALAVTAGVDWIGHLPGYHWHEGKSAVDYRLTAEVIDAAAAQKTKVILTASVVELFKSMSEEQKARVQQLQHENIAALRNAGVTLLSGSDLFMGSVVDELIYLQQFDFTAAELLEMATYTTPRVLLPQRDIGRLQEGFEASFLAFEHNPLRDLTELKQPTRVVRQGALMWSN
ncbi:amidohydrolase family protein [Pseudidiomarina insulisalsae]|uniref:Amidohydrolase-related domain-containing protein n=1 Tax=Pseudidiomarina insulisalsae TaxID=575789 RepID=A0A432YPV6_9GAMM|nr:amidohydrolase family protein [Pseudidiomarina insulisalsae]RUO63158.1 hypothetical protein CWI71_02740 [Pseudidiomarina insulisalsae]